MEGLIFGILWYMKNNLDIANKFYQARGPLLY